MKKVLFAAGAVSALVIALPAAAQSRDPIHQRFQQVEQRIDRGIQRGLINRNEAYRLRQAFRQLIRLDWQYRRDGLSRWEVDDLQRRTAQLSARVRYERRDEDRRYDDRHDDRRYERNDDSYRYDHRDDDDDDDDRRRGRGRD